MAEGDGTVYNEFKFRLLEGAYDLSDASAADSLRLMMVTGHTPDIDADTGYASVSADECSGTGYTATGEELTSQVTSKDTVNDRGKFDAADVTWSSIDVSGGGQPNYVILYDDSHASKLLIANWQIATATNGGDFTIQWHANGILLLT